MIIKRTILFAGLLFLFAHLLLFQSCRDDEFIPNPDISKLSFSADSILFDTVFTTVGSATKGLIVYNNYDKRIRIPSIELASGPNSYFRINVDGEPGYRHHDVEIEANDSIYIFAEVTVDPANPIGQTLPFIVEDSIMFKSGHNHQNVQLVAWGQEARFIRPNDTIILNNNKIACHLIREDTRWTSSIPYVVYGLVFVEPGKTLEISQGANIHMHNTASLIFLQESSFKVLGSPEAPVTIEGSRLESHYRERPGQWGRIWMTATSKDHEIRNAVIKNGTIGLHVDSIGSFTEPTLTLENTFIRNMSFIGLLAQGSHIFGKNVVISNCGENLLNLSLGGEYEFLHSTFANYYGTTIRQSPSLILNNYYIDINNNYQIRDLEKAYFGNSIIYGNREEEISTDFHNAATSANYTFDHSILKTTRDLSSDNYISVLKNENPLFHSTSDNDYRISENSPAKGAGDPEISNKVPYDIKGRSRQDRSDIGAYQYFEEENDNND